MLEELLFRILFLTIYVVFGSIRIYYRRKSAQSNNSEDELPSLKQRLGGWIGIVLSIGILGMLISLIIYLISPLGSPWFPLPLPALVRWLGVILECCTIPFLIWVHRTLGRYYSPELKIKEDHALIAIGPYARIRHPMYTIFILFIIATILITANLLVGFFGIIVILLFYPLSKREEKMLLAQFGDKYSNYMKHTGRFIPRLRREKNKT